MSSRTPNAVPGLFQHVHHCQEFPRRLQKKPPKLPLVVPCHLEPRPSHPVPHHLELTRKARTPFPAWFFQYASTPPGHQALPVKLSLYHYVGCSPRRLLLHWDRPFQAWVQICSVFADETLLQPTGTLPCLLDEPIWCSCFAILWGSEAHGWISFSSCFLFYIVSTQTKMMMLRCHCWAEKYIMGSRISIIPLPFYHCPWPAS